MIPLFFAAALAAAPDLRLDYTRESLVKTVRHYRQYVDGREVVGGERIEETHNGVTRVVYENVARDLADRDRAHVFSVCDDCVYVNVRGEARLARRTIVATSPLQPHAVYTDAATGAVLRDDPLFSRLTATARVFDVNPVTKLNDPTLRDHSNAASAVPDSAYTNVAISDLDPAAPLSGPNARIAGSLVPHADPTQSLMFDRSQPQFEEVNAYFQIDRTQRYLQSLGYIGGKRLVDYAIPIDPHGTSNDNSFYVQQAPAGHGELFFGDGGTDDAEDPDIMLHEFFHAVQDWIAPGALAGPPNSQARAISEGSADYWAFSSGYAGAIASGRDPYCIADWDARCGGDDPSQQCGYAEGADCLRRVDSTRTMADYNNSNQSGSEYDNAAIWSSALREIFLKVGKPKSDTLVIESLFGVPPLATFDLMAKKMIEADAALYGGANTPAICTAMTSRGILGLTECSNTPPRGEWTFFTAPDSIPIPDAGAPIESSIVVNDARTIDRVAVRVDIDHPVRGDLVITLVAPNGTEVLLKSSLDVDRTPGVHATFGIDAMAASSLDVLHGMSALGTWKLRVQDVFAGDVGKLEHWNLILQFAGSVPLTTRPSSTERLIIPVVSHITGAGGITWTSDVKFVGIGDDVTLVFTPSGHDGRTDFAVLKFATNKGEVVTVTDVVAQMGMFGSGQLEIQDALLAMSRIHGGGWEYVPALRPDATDNRMVGIRNDLNVRTNVGFAETMGRAAHVIGKIADTTIDVVVPPFSHVQFPVAGNGSGEISVDGGHVLAYAAVIERQTSDVTFHAPLPGLSVEPTINAGDWSTEPGGVSGYGIAPSLANVISRIVHVTPNGRYAEAQSYEFRSTGDLLGVENSERFRTNIVLVNIDDVPRNTTLDEYDASGRLLLSQEFTLAPFAIILMPMQTSASRIRNNGDLFVWASVIDKTNGDPMLIPLQ